MLEAYSESKGVFRTQESICDGAFLWIYLSTYYFCNVGSIIDVRLGYMRASENIKIFKLKLRWSKSSRLTAYYFCNISSIIDNVGPWRYQNFQSEAKVEQIIAIVTARSVSRLLTSQINNA